MKDGKLNNNIVFLDDCKIFNITTDGYFKHHPISNKSNIVCVSTPDELFQVADKDHMTIDYLILDYHLHSTDGLDIAQIIKYKLPECKIWLFTGMGEKYIFDKRKELLDRFIHKDMGIPFLLDELSKYINQSTN